MSQERLPNALRIAAAPVTPFGLSHSEHLQSAMAWLESRRARLHHEGCSVHAPSARCNCGLHKCLTDVRAVINSIDEQKMAFDLVAHLHRQAAFSAATFGPGPRVKGVTDHIAKELQEVRDSNGSLAEWVDVIILGLDGAWRSGATPIEIATAIEAKQTKNEGRIWPDWRTADPDKAIEHDRSDEAPSP